jgi:hypothetical protein
MSSDSEVIDELIPGRRASRARVIAASLSHDDIDHQIKQAQKEVEPLIGRKLLGTNVESDRLA